MRRRDFLGGLSCAAMAAPLTARAQQPKQKALGLTVAPTLLARADEVIE